ncbi:MAG: Smr/MutS family protein [Bacillota bacterium]
MKQIDLHGLRTQEALELLVATYNASVSQGDLGPIKVIHGYGSSGTGGDTKRAVRSLLQRNRHCAEYVLGEDVEGNPGYTIVYPKHRLPTGSESLWQSILRLCTTPKTQAEVVRKLARRNCDHDIAQALKELESSGKLRSFFKGGVKHYVASEGSHTGRKGK